MKKIIFTFILLTIIFLASSDYVYDIELKKEENQLSYLDMEVHPSELTPSVTSYFERLRKNSRFNGAVLVGQNGKVIYDEQFGVANFSSKNKITNHSCFQLASVSKQITAMAVVLLKQRGLISYSDSFQKYFPDFPHADITIHHLLAHQGGLPNYMYYTEHYTDRTQPINNDTVLALLQDSTKNLIPFFKPGRRYNYSNTGYALLAKLVEQVTKTSFNDFLRQNLFLPAGMNNSYAGDEQVSDQNKTWGYNYNTVLTQKFYQDPIVGDKSIFSTSHDLFRWDRFLSSGKILRLSELDTAFKMYSSVRRPYKGYGYGWRLWDYHDGRKIEYHTGWYRGYTSLFVRIRATNSVIIILSNRVNRSFMGSFHELVDLLYPIPKENS